VCHPGGPGFSSRYFGDLAGLGAAYELVFLDPRGTGVSERPAASDAYEIEDYADDVEELRIHLELDRILLLGHSHGGVAALAYAAKYPDRVEALVAASTLARFASDQEEAMGAAVQAHADEPWYPAARAALEAEWETDWRTDEELAALVWDELPFYFARYGEAERAYVDSLRGEIPNGDALGLFNSSIVKTFDLRPGLANISAPTLVIAGRDDFITGPVCAEEIAASIPDSRLVLLDHCGHFVFVEQREQFSAEVEGFLRRVQSTS
jgi:pimeloyl-ACP methyl ester carboxylesterase